MDPGASLDCYALDRFWDECVLLVWSRCERRHEQVHISSYLVFWLGRCFVSVCNCFRGWLSYSVLAFYCLLRLLSAFCCLCFTHSTVTLWPLHPSFPQAYLPFLLSISYLEHFENLETFVNGEFSSQHRYGVLLGGSGVGFGCLSYCILTCTENFYAFSYLYYLSLLLVPLPDPLLGSGCYTYYLSSRIIPFTPNYAKIYGSISGFLLA